MAKAWVVGVIGFVCGAIGASGAWTAFPPKAPPPPTAATPEPVATEDSALKKANSNLTAALHECDRRLAELGEHPVGDPPPVAEAAPSASGRRGRRERPSLTKEDWERMAESGVVPVRVPCIREKPWTPNERVVQRLGLAPSDTEALKSAYEASNKRMNDQIKPLCVQALGSPEAADRVGITGCIDAINHGARKTNPDAAKAALSRVAEVQAGKRDAPRGGDVPPIEQLGLLLTKESKTFEDDLAGKLGPEEAKRLAQAPELCTERKMLRAGEVDPSVFGGGPGGPGGPGGAREGGGRRGRGANP